MDFVADEHRSHRDHAAGQALGSGDDIRRHIEIIGGEGRAETAKTGDHLVKDQQETVLVADFTKPLQISLRRDQHSGRTGHRLDDHGGDCGGIVKHGNTFQLVGKLGPVFRLAAGEGVAREVVRVRHMVDTRQQCAEHLAVGNDAADRNAAEIHPVIAALATDQPCAAALAAHPMIGNRHLQRGLDRLRSGIGIEAVIHAVRRQVDQPVRQFERLRMPHLEGRRIIKLRHLVLHGLNDLRPRMTRIHAPQACRAVKDLAAVGGRVVHVPGADHHARVRLELPVRGERHPESTEIVWLRDCAVRHGGTLHHCGSARGVAALRAGNRTGTLRPGSTPGHKIMKYHFYRLVKSLRMKLPQKIVRQIGGT